MANNTIRVSQKDCPLIAAYGDNHCLLWVSCTVWHSYTVASGGIYGYERSFNL